MINLYFAAFALKSLWILFFKCTERTFKTTFCNVTHKNCQRAQRVYTMTQGREFNGCSTNRSVGNWAAVGVGIWDQGVYRSPGTLLSKQKLVT